MKIKRFSDEMIRDTADWISECTNKNDKWNNTSESLHEVRTHYEDELTGLCTKKPMKWTIRGCELYCIIGKYAYYIDRINKRLSIFKKNTMGNSRIFQNMFATLDEAKAAAEAHREKLAEALGFEKVEV